MTNPATNTAEIKTLFEKEPFVFNPRPVRRLNHDPLIGGRRGDKRFQVVHGKNDFLFRLQHQGFTGKDPCFRL